MRNNLNDYWELTHIPQAEWTTIRDACEKRLKKRRYVNKRLGDSNCKYDLICKYDEDILKITNRRLISPSKNDFSETISSYIETMPFEQRKSIVESFIAPDKGGSCVINGQRIMKKMRRCVHHAPTRKIFLEADSEKNH